MSDLGEVRMPRDLREGDITEGKRFRTFVHSSNWRVEMAAISAIPQQTTSSLQGLPAHGTRIEDHSAMLLRPVF
jgi:hypothetical protein